MERKLHEALVKANPLPGLNELKLEMGKIVDKGTQQKVWFGSGVDIPERDQKDIDAMLRKLYNTYEHNWTDVPKIDTLNKE